MAIGMTEKERATLEAVIKHGSITRAAGALRLPISTVSQRVMRMSIKARRYELWTKEFERYKLQMPTKYFA